MTRDESAAAELLLVDDDCDFRRLTREHLEAAGYTVREAADGRSALELLTSETKVVLLDLKMPGMGGVECLEEIKKLFPQIQVIILSSVREPAVIVDLTKRGAFWYLTKNADPGELRSLVAQAFSHAALQIDNLELREAVGQGRPPIEFVHESPQAKLVELQLRRLADLHATVLLTGESGVGKSVLARRIHDMGSREGGPFIGISCAAMPRELLEAELFGNERGAFTGAYQNRPGKLELAHGGTVLLDEIGELPLELQPKLLLFFQDRVVHRLGGHRGKQVDVRIICATNRDLESMCVEGLFRQDLFFRINVLPLEIPPLRQRQADIAALVDRILARIVRQRGCSPFCVTAAARSALVEYHWPGNIRELENVLERATAFASGSTLDLESFDLRGFRFDRSAKPLRSDLGGRSLEELEREAIVENYKLCGGNKTATAKVLGVTKKSLYNKIKRFGMESEIERALAKASS